MLGDVNVYRYVKVIDQYILLYATRSVATLSVLSLRYDICCVEHLSVSSLCKSYNLFKNSFKFLAHPVPKL